MTLPSSGQIAFSDLNIELGRAYNSQLDMNDTYLRLLAAIPSGQISMSDFYGKSWNVSCDCLVVGGGGDGGYSMSSGGSGGVQRFIGTLNVGTSYSIQVGAGGSGGNGGDSVFNGITGGGGGRGGDLTFSSPPWGGDGGTGGTSGYPGYHGGGAGTHATYYYTGDPSVVYGEGYGGGAGGSAVSNGGSAYNAWPDGFYTYGGNGADGYQWPIDGQYYAGSKGGGIYDTTSGNRNGSSGLGASYYGGSSQQGCVVVSYLSPVQRFTGGSVSYNSGRWTHLFTSASTLTHL